MRKKNVRTTITLRREHQVLLRTLAAKRGQRGFSKIVAEALDYYFQEKAAKEVENLFRPKRPT
uniref:CopG family transcriptional regulator n=1 Tax=Thermus tengchongensis TaxID=1214928 RepID=A0A7V4A2Z0_9DEIN